MKTMLRVFFLLIFCSPSILKAGNSVPTLDFSADKVSGCGSVTVTFFDESFETAGDPFVSWKWYFGDGTTSTELSPTHTYATQGAYNVKLEITAQSGWSGSIEKPAYINVGNSLAVDLGPDTLVCSGASIILDAKNPGSTYLWSDGSATQQAEFYFEGEYSVEVFRDGCVGRDTIYVQHGAVLYADFDLSLSGTCIPVKADFIEFSQACTGFVTEWNWDFGDGSTSTERTPSHMYAAAGDYNVTLVVKNNSGSVYSTSKVITIEGTPGPVVELGPDVTICEYNELVLDAGSDGTDFSWSTGETTSSITVIDAGTYHVTVTKDGCIAEDSIKVAVTPLLRADFISEKVSNCLPVKMQFTDKTAFCEGSVSEWSWDFGDGTTSDLQNPEHEYLSKGQFVVRLTVTHSSGEIVMRSKKIDIDPSAITLDIGMDTTICSGDMIMLDAGNPGATYLWNTGETTQQIYIDFDGDYSVNVNVNGCEANDTIIVQTKSSAAVKWGYSAGSECLPVSVDFTDSTVMSCGQSISRWEWDFGDGNYSTEQHPVHNYLSAGAFVVRLTVTTSGGSTITSSKKVEIKNTIPVVDLPASFPACRNSTVQLDADVTGAEYLWTPSAGLNAADIRNPVVYATKSGWYTVQVTKCMVTVKDSVFINIDSTNKPVIKQSLNSLKSSEASHYQWFRDGAAIPGANSRELRLDRRGYYSVKVFNKTGCENQSDAYFFTPMSRGIEIGKIRIRCSPNPSRGQINIILSDLPEKPAKVTLYDNHGKKIMITLIRDHVNPINAVKLAKGLYFVEVDINNKKEILPVIVQ